MMWTGQRNDPERYVYLVDLIRFDAKLLLYEPPPNGLLIDAAPIEILVVGAHARHAG